MPVHPQKINRYLVWGLSRPPLPYVYILFTVLSKKSNSQLRQPTLKPPVRILAAGKQHLHTYYTINIRATVS
jgi:hypothetical protein